MGIILVYITYPDQSCAQKITTSLLEKKLIACANLFPIKSSYWWQAQITNSKEIVAIAKSTKEKWGAIESVVREQHPYEVPCIVQMDAGASTEYQAWIEEQLQ